MGGEPLRKQYVCEVCGEVFLNEDACREHEAEHEGAAWAYATNHQMALALKETADAAPDWHVGGKVAGREVNDFVGLLKESAKRLEKEHGSV